MVLTGFQRRIRSNTRWSSSVSGQPAENRFSPTLPGSFAVSSPQSSSPAKKKNGTTTSKIEEPRSALQWRHDVTRPSCETLSRFAGSSGSSGEVKKTINLGLFRIYPKVTKGSTVTVGKRKIKPEKLDQEKKEINWENVISRSLAQITAVITLYVLLQQVSN